MISGGGFTTDPAFHQDGTLGSGSVLDTSHLFYNGNSQGGIMGGALTAVTPDFTRASLGVPAMNYSVLLPRSVDFDPFAGVLYPSYPDELSRPLALDLIQMLWDRGDPNGYANRMTDDPLPDTPAHQVLLNVAFGDHQVTDYQADVEARTVGARAHRPVLFDGRWPDTNVLWRVPSIRSLPIHRLGRLLLGHRADPRRTGRDHRRHRPAALREPAEQNRRRPPRRAAGDPGRAAARLGLLRRGDPRKRQLRRRPLLRDRVQRALAAAAASRAPRSDRGGRAGR